MISENRNAINFFFFFFNVLLDEGAWYFLVFMYTRIYIYIDI